MQERCNSIANALELSLFCIKPSNSTFCLYLSITIIKAHLHLQSPSIHVRVPAPDRVLFTSEAMTILVACSRDDLNKAALSMRIAWPRMNSDVRIQGNHYM